MNERFSSEFALWDQLFFERHGEYPDGSPCDIHRYMQSTYLDESKRRSIHGNTTHETFDEFWHDVYQRERKCVEAFVRDFGMDALIALKAVAGGIGNGSYGGMEISIGRLFYWGKAWRAETIEVKEAIAPYRKSDHIEILLF